MKELDIENNFLAIEKEYSNFKDSKIVIVSAPFEKTVSYGKGTKKGPKAIIEASHYVEFYDEELDKELCFDKGVCTLEPLKLGKLSPKKALDLIYKTTLELIKKDKFVVTLGGEHSISSAPIKAHLECYNDVSIIQVDAHSDLRDSYQGTKYSHASVMARVAELTKDITQIGIRAQAIEESKFIKENGIKTFYARDIRLGKYKNWQEEVLKGLNKNVYITFDVDGLDPSIIPATGTPEPGGMMWDEIMNLFALIGEKRNIIGIDVVELAPNKKDVFSNFNVAKLTYKLLNYAFINK